MFPVYVEFSKSTPLISIFAPIGTALEVKATAIKAQTPKTNIIFQSSDHEDI